MRPVSPSEGSCEVAPHCAPHCVQPGVFPSRSRRQLSGREHAFPTSSPHYALCYSADPSSKLCRPGFETTLSQSWLWLTLCSKRTRLSVYGSHNHQMIKDTSSHFDSSFSMTVALWHCGTVSNIIKFGICLILKLSIACVSDQRIRLLYHPNAQNQTHTDSKDTIATCFGIRKYTVLR